MSQLKKGRPPRMTKMVPLMGEFVGKRAPKAQRISNRYSGPIARAWILGVHSHLHAMFGTTTIASAIF
jgi:hypothetical protein